MMRRTVFMVCIICLLGMDVFPAIGGDKASADRIMLYSGMRGQTGLALDSRGNAYIADRNDGCVFCLTRTMGPILLARVPGIPTALAVDSLRNVFVGTEGGAIYLVELDGSMAEVYRCQSSPTGLAIDRDGGLVVATATGEVFKVDRADFQQGE